MQQQNPDLWELEQGPAHRGPHRKSAGREVFAGGSAGVYRAGSAATGAAAGGEEYHRPAPPRRAARPGAAPRAARTREHRVNAARPPQNAPRPAADGRTKVRRPVRAPAGPPKGGKPAGKSTARVVITNLLKALLVVVCVCIIIFAIIAVQIGAYLAEATADDDQLFNLENLALPQNGAQLARDPATGEWVEYYKLVSANANSVWVDLHEIPQPLIDAVVSTEDRRYYEHGGVNWVRTFQAALNEVTGSQSTFGGSTITQQLVKNLTGEDQVTDEEGSMLGGYQRKMKEIVRAQYLDKTYGKDLVMEAYLNTLPLSGTIIGVQAAAKEYFNKDVGELTLAESALIAGITQAPGRYNPFTNPENAQDRRDQVLYNMFDNGKISQGEYDEAVAQPLGIYDGPRETAVTGFEGSVTSYFTDAVYYDVVQDILDAGLGGVTSWEQAVNYYYTAGLQIETTVDLSLQQTMEEVYRQGNGSELFPDLQAEVEVENEDGSVTTETASPQSAMAVMRYDGTLAGVVGGLGEKTESLGLNRAVQSERQVGSTMKPIGAYALGVEYELIDFSRLLPDSYVIPEQEWPKNYPGLYAPSGNNVLACDALAESLNTCAAHVGEWVGVDAMYEFMEDTLEITSLVSEGTNNDMGLAPLVLGSMTSGMKPVELANAFTMFGGADSYGVFTSYHTYERVLDAQGNVLLEPDLVTVQAVSPETGYIVNRMMRGVLDSPVGTANGMGLTTSDAVGKTGTTSDDKDRWFVGLTPSYVSAVWWGYDKNATINWSPAAATNPPPNVWRTVMEAVQAGTEATDFPARPEGVTEQRFCTQSGLLAGASCSSTRVGYYAAGNTPAVCDVHGAADTADTADDGGDGDSDDGDDDD